MCHRPAHEGQASKGAGCGLRETYAGSIRFADIEALVMALGGEVREGDGSRVMLELGSAVKHAHRPYPGKEARKYQIDEIRAWLQAQGISP